MKNRKRFSQRGVSILFYIEALNELTMVDCAMSFICVRTRLGEDTATFGFQKE